MNNYSSERKFYSNPLGSNILVGAGTLQIVSGLFMRSSFGLGVSLGILMITVGILSKNRPLLTLFDDHAEFRPAPIRGLTLFQYGDIESIDIQNKKMLIALKNNVSPVKINLRLFSTDERAALPSIIESKKSSARAKSE